MAKKKGNWKIWAAALGALLIIGGVAGVAPTASPVPTPTEEPTATPEPTPTPYRIRGLDPETIVYVSRKGVIHFDKDCSGMKYYTEMTLEKADAGGYSYCEHCW